MVKGILVEVAKIVIQTYLREVAEQWYNHQTIERKLVAKNRRKQPKLPVRWFDDPPESQREEVRTSR
jgi:hypothetical protein